MLTTEDITNGLLGHEKINFYDKCCLQYSTHPPSIAKLKVQFIEGAPKDRFVMRKNGDCNIDVAQFVIDFEQSNAGLIVDITGSGAGGRAFQPFEVTVGARFLAVISENSQVTIEEPACPLSRPHVP